jgi:tyrosine-protein kinase Etk/Wzc
MEEQEISLLDLLQVIIKRKKFVMKFCAIAVVLAAIITLVMPVTYTATAKVLPPQKDSTGGLSAMLSQMAGLSALAGGALGLSGSSDVYVGILKSRSVADAVIASLDLYKIYKTKTPDKTRKALEGRVKIKAAKDGIITITADDRDPKRAAALANSFVRELDRKSVDLNLTRAGSERQFLEKRLGVVRQDLKNAEEDFKSFQEKNKAIKVDAQAVASIEGIARLKAEIVSREVQLASLLSYQTEENPEVKAIQTALSKLKSRLASMEGSSYGGSDAIPSIGNVPNLGLEYARKLRELKIQEMIFEQLTKQNELAKLSQAKDSASIQVLDYAVAPYEKSKPKRTLIVLLVAFTSFFISLFVIFAMEYFERLPEEDRSRWREMREAAGFKRK